MSTKRALIVDDSRSARHILGRMLESFGLEVDAVESAELALTFLQTARPDVIFMDHLMPGMDGFSAVRVIKANPDTATIPVLMYTSQEGEMYLSQARALGAMGVLPKTLKHADVAEALQHLNLHTPVSAASLATAGARPARIEPQVEVIAAQPPEPAIVPPESPALAVPPLSAQQWAHRIATEVHAEMQRRQPEPDNDHVWRGWALVASCAALLLLGVVIYQQSQIQQQLAQLQRLQPSSTEAATPAALPAAINAPVAALQAPVSAAPVVGPVAPEVEEFAYGDVPLSGSRLDRLRMLVDKLRDQHSKATVRVEVFLGDFCLTGTPTSGYVVANDDLLTTRCDVTGNPFGDALTVQQRQSVSFANLVASINSNTAAGIKVQLVDGAHKTLMGYPAPSATLTAGVWNRIAERNQRVEFTVVLTP